MTMNTAVTNIVDFPGCEVSQAIARTATEIAAKFVDDNASERAPYKVRVLAYGAVSTLSDGAFRLLVIRSMYADANGANSRPTQEVLAELMRREERTISTLDKELRNAGFITLGRRANNRSHDPSLRSTSYNLITHTQMDNIVNEIVNDRKRTSGRNPDNDQKLASAGKYDRKPTSTGSGFHRKSSAVSTGSELPPTLLTNPSTLTQCLTNNIVQPEKKSGCLSTEVVDDLPLVNDQLGFSTWKVAAGIMAIGVAFGANQLPASAITIGAEPGVGREYAKQMPVEPATLPVGATSTSVRYDLAWNVATAATEAPEATTDGKPLKKKKEKTASAEYTHDFEEFWKIYPRREGKGLAFKSWQKLTIERKRIAYGALKKQLKVLIDRMSDPRGNFCPLPATWINQCRFDDDADQMELAKKTQQQQKNDYSFSGEYTGMRL